MIFSSISALSINSLCLLALLGDPTGFLFLLFFCDISEQLKIWLISQFSTYHTATAVTTSKG